MKKEEKERMVEILFNLIIGEERERRRNQKLCKYCGIEIHFGEGTSNLLKQHAWESEKCCGNCYIIQLERWMVQEGLIEKQEWNTSGRKN